MHVSAQITILKDLLARVFLSLSVQTDLEEVHFYVINSLANLASNAETHLQLDETNVPHTLLKWCSNSDDRIRIGATRGLANLCSNRGLHRNMVWWSDERDGSCQRHVPIHNLPFPSFPIPS
jgi:hypothetical protein